MLLQSAGLSKPDSGALALSLVLEDLDDEAKELLRIEDLVVGHKLAPLYELQIDSVVDTAQQQVDLENNELDYVKMFFFLHRLEQALK